MMDSEPTYHPDTAVDSAARAPSVFRAPVLAAFRGMRRGRLTVELPTGETEDFGEGPIALPLGIRGSARICVRREAFFRKCLLYGDIGFAESLMDGDWNSPDLVAVVGWFILNLDNAPTLSGSRAVAAGAFNLLRLINRLGHLLRDGSRRNASRNIREHYDLSNDFFALFLDPTLMYSSARWSRPSMTLEEAQTEKNDRLCRQLRLRESDHVLEIGTGWGGWALHAARNYGCRITTVTLSPRQRDHAVKRIQDAGLSDRITVLLQDFRDIRGSFDKIVSIEMVEALGHRHQPAFCEIVGRSLKPEGLLALQFITCPDGRYRDLRRGVDFIQKHVFPGSLLLSMNRLNGLMSKKAGLVLHNVEDMGADYALTLRRWSEAFLGRLDDVRRLGFDDRFIRKWHYYLAYCEAAFAMRNISVVQTLHTRPNNLSLA